MDVTENTRPAWAEKYITPFIEIYGDCPRYPISSFSKEDWLFVKKRMLYGCFHQECEYHKHPITVQIAEIYESYLQTNDVKYRDVILQLAVEYEDSFPQETMVAYLDQNMGYISRDSYSIFSYYALNSSIDFESDFYWELGYKFIPTLYSWLHENCEGKWCTNDGIVYFENLTDLVLCKLIMEQSDAA